jgi:hypothetical protein
MSVEDLDYTIIVILAFGENLKINTIKYQSNA